MPWPAHAFSLTSYPQYYTYILHRCRIHHLDRLRCGCASQCERRQDFPAVRGLRFGQYCNQPTLVDCHQLAEAQTGRGLGEASDALCMALQRECPAAEDVASHLL